jgi:hypothetical protein
MTITILEFINDDGQSQFYSAYGSRDVKNAVVNYLLENNLAKNEQEAVNMLRIEDGECIVDDVCIAYETELE